MDNNIIEILPKDKKDIQDALEAKICLDVIDSGDVSDEFLDLIWKDMLEEKEMAKDSVFAKVKKLFMAG